MAVGTCGLQLREGCRELAEWPSGAPVLAKLVRNHPETYHAIFGFDADLPSRSLDFVVASFWRRSPFFFRVTKHLGVRRFTLSTEGLNAALQVRFFHTITTSSAPPPTL
jgi:hypothetical protein